MFTFVGGLLFSCVEIRGPGGIRSLDPQRLDPVADLMFLLSDLAIARGTRDQHELLRG